MTMRQDVLNWVLILTSNVWWLNGYIAWFWTPSYIIYYFYPQSTIQVKNTSRKTLPGEQSSDWLHWKRGPHFWKQECHYVSVTGLVWLCWAAGAHRYLPNHRAHLKGQPNTMVVEACKDLGALQHLDQVITFRGYILPQIVMHCVPKPLLEGCLKIFHTLISNL